MLFPRHNLLSSRAAEGIVPLEGTVYPRGREGKEGDGHELEDERAVLQTLPITSRGYGRAWSRDDGRFQAVTAWPYCMDDRFVRCLEQRQPVALILLAYFAVLLQSLEPAFWFLEGWRRHVLAEVGSLLGERYARWLRWPGERVREMEGSS